MPKNNVTNSYVLYYYNPLIPEQDMEEYSSVFKSLDINIGYEESHKILSFNALKDGWHFGEGVAVKKDIIKMALALDREAYKYGYYVTDAFPGLDGEIAFTIYFGYDYFEFLIENNGLINFFHEYKNKDVSIESNISLKKALKKIDMLKGEICTLSEYSTSNIGISEKTDLIVWPSKTSGVVFPSYPKNVFNEVEKESANTSEFITDQLRQIPLFIGDSPSKTYQIPV